MLAPGANVYHYNHIHVDLMRRASGRRICEPAAIPGEVVAARARARYAAQHYGEHYGDPGVTGSIKYKRGARSAIPARTTTACRSPCRAMIRRAIMQRSNKRL